MCWETSSEEAMVEVSGYLYRTPLERLLTIRTRCDMQLEDEVSISDADLDDVQGYR